MKRFAKSLGALLFIGTFAGCTDKPNVQPPQPGAQAAVPPTCVVSRTDSLCSASMAALLGNPSGFDGRLVSTLGYVHFEFEGNAVHLHKEDFDQGLFLNSLWISLAKGVPEEACQDSYAIIEGRFRAGLRGHFGMFPGEIAEVTRCEKWVSPRK